jgi:hypothetical protein
MQSSWSERGVDDGMRFAPKGCTLLAVEEATRRLGDRSIFLYATTLCHYTASC